MGEKREWDDEKYRKPPEPPKPPKAPKFRDPFLTTRFGGYQKPDAPDPQVPPDYSEWNFPDPGFPEEMSTEDWQAWFRWYMTTQVPQHIADNQPPPTSPPPGEPPTPPTITPLKDIQWKVDAGIKPKDGKAPAWWKALVPENASDAERADVQALMMLNTLIPYMSPEDQRRAALQLYAAGAGSGEGTTFADFYDPDDIKTSKIPVSKLTALFSKKKNLEVVDEDYYASKKRAKGMMDILSQMREKTTGERGLLGPGYSWLQSIIGAIGEFAPERGEWVGGGRGAKRRWKKFEGPQHQTRAQRLALRGMLDPLLAQAQSGALGPIGAIGQMIAQPFFSQTSLWPTTRDVTGTPRFGDPNRAFF
jgi:hypothetical protein